MIVLLIGAGTLAAVLGLSYMKDRLRNPLLARIAYSEPTMRVVIIAVALIAIGLLVVVGDLFT